MMLPPGIKAGAIPHGATGLIAVDLAALRRNYRKVKALAAASETAAVVKADGYGLGAGRVAAALAEEGCRTFFVATLGEGRSLRETQLQADIYVLDGLLPETASLFSEANLIPVLNSMAEVEDWAAFQRCEGIRKRAALHVDTGMTRLGLRVEDASGLDEIVGRLSGGRWEPLVMTHYACADDPAHPLNAIQRQRFLDVTSHLKGVRTSLANSAGVFLGRDFHGGMIRPGIALYGGRPNMDPSAAMNPVVTVYGRIAQVRIAERGETVGYGAAHTLRRRTRIATVSLGYADGVLRAASASDAREGLAGYVGDHRVPMLGRVSMDLIMFDVTDVAEEAVARGGWIELMGERQTIDDVARVAGTIGYEVLTSLSRRLPRVYT